MNPFERYVFSKSYITSKNLDLLKKSQIAIKKKGLIPHAFEIETATALSGLGEENVFVICDCYKSLNKVFKAYVEFYIDKRGKATLMGLEIEQVYGSSKKEKLI